MATKASVIGGKIRKTGGTFGTSDLTVNNGDVIELQKTDDLYSATLAISRTDGNRNLLSCLTPPWHAGTNFVWPAIGRYDNDVIGITILPGASGSEYTVGNTEIGATPAGKHKTLLHGAFTAGANKPCNIRLTFADNSVQDVTVTPIILAAPTELIHHVVVVPDSWGQGAARIAATDFSLATHWEAFGVHYTGNATGSNKSADATAAMNANFNFGTRSAGIGWASSVVANVHAAGRKAIVCIGGEGLTAGCIYKWATSEGRANSVTEVLALLDEVGFDGVMIDIEGDVNGYISYDVWMITADFCRRLREARPSIIMTGAIYTLLTSNGWPDYENWWDFNGGKVACSTCFDWVENQSYGVSNNIYVQNSYSQWFSSPIYGGSGPFSWFPVTATTGYENFSQYSNHPVDWNFSSRLMEKFGMPPQHVCMGYQWHAAMRGPTVQAPGDSQASTTVWWQLDYDFVEQYILTPNIGTVVNDTAGCTYRHFNPAISVGGSPPASWVDYPSPYFFQSARTFLTARGHLGVLSFNRNAAGDGGLPMAWPNLNPSKDFVSDKPTLAPITGAPVNSTASSAPLTASGMNSPGHVSVRNATGVTWRKTESGTTSAWVTTDGTVAPGGTVEFTKTTGVLGGFTTQDPVIFCGWPLTLTVTTAAGSVPANTWNPADKAASITLGSGNLVAVRSGGAESASLVRALRKIPNIGKWIWSVKTGGSFGMANDVIGTVIASGSGDYYGRTTDAWSYFSDGGWHAWNGDNSGGNGWWGTWPSYASTDDMIICFDTATKYLWIANGNGIWNNDSTANPATGVGGLYTPMTGNLFAMAALTGTTSPANSATINMGRISLPRTVSGYTPLDNAP